jgi:hypothetical protein
VPRLLPWLAILSLLALKPNRGGSAWWIWLPVGCPAGGCLYLQQTLQGSPTDSSANAFVLLLDVPLALTFGLAALWLLAPYLGSRHRFRTSLGSLAVLAAFMVFSFAAMIGWGVGAEPVASLLDPRHSAATASVGLLALPFLALLVLPAPVVATAIVLCGLACRGRHRPIGLYPLLFLSLLIVWVLPALLQLLCRIAPPNSLEYALVLGIGPPMVAVTFATLLPYLVLSSASPFYRERLKILLRVQPQAQLAIGAAANQPADAVPEPAHLSS